MIYLNVNFKAVRMHEFVEKLRGANVWGLPSLPYPYVLWIVIIVKTNLLLTCSHAATTFGLYLAIASDQKQWTSDMTLGAVILMCNVLFENFMWQGNDFLHNSMSFDFTG